MWNRKSLRLAAIAMLLAACNGQNGEPCDTPPVQSDDWRDILRDPGQPLEQRIEAAFAGIEQDSCFLEADDVSRCSWSHYAVGPAHIDPAFVQREAVLIADVLEPAVEMLRYRNRVLGFYRVKSDGTIAAVPLEWQLPAVFGDIVTGFATAPAIPARDLGALQPRLQEVYGASVPSLGMHGLVVFNVIADLVPENPIVFLDIHPLTFHRSVPELVCAVDSSGGGAPLNALRERSERFAASLRTLFETHNIHFVNASWGYTIETVRGPWARVCGTPVPPDDVLLAILDAYRPIFDALFDTEGVFTAHASLASPVDAHSPFDQPLPAFPNRLRVGVFQYAGHDVPEEGVSGVPAAWSPVPGAADADVWVNNGCPYDRACRAEGALGLTLQYGMGSTDFALAQSSFISPVLLGTFIHFRNQSSGVMMDDALIRNVIDKLTHCAPGEPPECRYIDPLLHGHLDGR